MQAPDKSKNGRDEALELIKWLSVWEKYNTTEVRSAPATEKNPKKRPR